MVSVLERWMLAYNLVPYPIRTRAWSTLRQPLSGSAILIEGLIGCRT